MDNKIIYGIQQIGVGVENVQQAWAWYRKYFGMDIKAFEEAAVAELMKYYTEGEPRPRHAVLAINLQSGGGFEIWQHTGKTPAKPKFEIQLGDLGIFIGKQKTKNINLAFDTMKSQNLDLLTDIATDPEGKKHFFIRDPFNNIFQIIENDYIFDKTKSVTGGVLGAIIGVSDIDKAMKLYSDALGYSVVVYDKTDTFNDFAGIPGGAQKARRVLLRPAVKATGGFAPLLGPSELELVQVIDAPVRNIYENRIWGDLGFIHLCFDVHNMASVKKDCSEQGFEFTVDSNDSFDMGAAAGHFAYVSDPDGTPIEFVETFKLPIIKAIGLGVNLEKRDPHKPLSKWLLKAMRINRVK
ncbi:MAG: VOC family protein [Bacteroidales bacterium]|nr:VOC family protein [Bacteroidales bacterium]